MSKASELAARRLEAVQQVEQITALLRAELQARWNAGASYYELEVETGIPRMQIRRWVKDG